MNLIEKHIMVGHPVDLLPVRGFKQQKVHLVNKPKHVKKKNTLKINLWSTKYYTVGRKPFSHELKLVIVKNQIVQNSRLIS